MPGYDSGAFIDGGQFTVQVSRVSFSGRNLALGGGDLTHGLRKGSHIGQDNQNVHMLFKRQILCSCQCNLRSNETLHNRIICQVDEGDNVIGNTALLECPAEIIPDLVFYTHCRKYNGKLFGRIISQGCLLYDLGSKLIVGKSVAGENRAVSVRGSE